MIPSKLYIPTTTLNFNNIMASESISPAGFYSIRGFGYKRFDKVEPNNLDNRIVLYEKFPIFKINDDELENYPLVIEIYTETIGEDTIKEENGIFYSEETIYLNPFSTRLIFNSETEKLITLSKVEQSLNTKMVPIYRNCITEKTSNIESFEWEMIDLIDSKIDFLKISKDRKINKLKGFLYAYLLGFNKSVSKDVAYAKKRTKFFSNELSALLNSISARETHKILDCLEVFVADINRISGKVKIELKDMPIIQHSRIIESVQNNNFLPKLFNEYLAENWNSEDFMNSRLEFATTGGKIFKEELKDKWENSPTKSYINNLRNNLASHTPFLLQSTDNLTLQSFGAFCQKGEEDIVKLEDYLISNGIGNFHIAFALWGIVFGFANTPKTLTNDLFLSNDLDYISDVYKYIFKQVHGIELNGNLKKIQEESELISKPSKVYEQTKEKNLVVESPKKSSLELELLEFGEFTSREKAIQKEIVFKLNEIGIYSLADWDDKKVDSIKWSASKGQKKLMTVIAKSLRNVTKNQKQTIKKQAPTLFDFPLEKDFYKDTNVGGLIEYLLPNDNKVRKQFKEDLDWFQGNYQEFYEDKKKGKQSGYYFGKPTDNNSVIEKFQDFLTNKKNSSQDWLRNIYFPINIELIIEKLKELYLHK